MTEWVVGNRIERKSKQSDEEDLDIGRILREMEGEHKGHCTALQDAALVSL